MQNTRQGLVILFIICAKENNIHELNINEFRENFRKISESEKYQDLFGAYCYNEDGICIQFEKELQQLIKHKQIHLYKNMIYIYNIRTHCIEHIDIETHSLFHQMINDYVKLNMQKQKVKMV